MIGNHKITPEHLRRRAIVYLRQSTEGQVRHNKESQKLQYGMQERLRALGWHDIDVIDDDLGKSAGGTVRRPGFERMVADVCLGTVGVVAARMYLMGDCSQYASKLSYGRSSPR